MRKLNLKKENLADLTTGEMDLVVGGVQEITQYPRCQISGIVPCYPTYRCPTEECVATLAGC